MCVCVDLYSIQLYSVDLDDLDCSSHVQSAFSKARSRLWQPLKGWLPRRLPKHAAMLQRVLGWRSQEHRATKIKKVAKLDRCVNCNTLQYVVIVCNCVLYVYDLGDSTSSRNDVHASQWWEAVQGLYILEWTRRNYLQIRTAALVTSRVL